MGNRVRLRRGPAECIGSAIGNPAGVVLEACGFEGSKVIEAIQISGAHGNRGIVRRTVSCVQDTNRNRAAADVLSLWILYPLDYPVGNC